MSPSRIKLSVIILFYFGERWIDSCVRSLENQSLSRALYEIVLVDNGGTTPSVEKFGNGENITPVRFPVNYGFADGNNRALPHARGEIVLLMNQDVIVHHNCLEEILTAFDRFPEAGVISANMLMVTSKDFVDPHAAISEAVGSYRLTPLGYASYNLSETDRAVLPVDFVSGNALGFRKVILKDVGNYLFDARLGSYAEDLDFSIRLKKTKWAMYVRPGAVVYHFRDDAFSGRPGRMLRKLIHVSRNRLIVYHNNLETADFFKKLPALLLGISFKVARPDGDRRFHLLKFIIALGLTPLIIIFFGVKVMENIRAGEAESLSSKHARRT